MSDQNIAKETVGNKDSRVNSGPWEPFGDDKGAEEMRVWHKLFVKTFDWPS